MTERNVADLVFAAICIIVSAWMFSLVIDISFTNAFYLVSAVGLAARAFEGGK